MLSGRQSVLIVDDDLDFGQMVGDLLAVQGYEVSVRNNLDSTLEFLKTNRVPTFLVVDRVLSGNALDESGKLRELCEQTTEAFVIVYTCASDLTQEEVYSIHEQGAIRVINRDTAMEFAKDILSLTAELEELLLISRSLQEGTNERAKMTSALVGTGVSTSVVDTHYQVWFTSPPEHEFGFVGIPGATRLCWQVFHGLPAWMGPCWACPVAEVLTTGSAVQRTLFARSPEGDAIWRSNFSTPICESASTPPIAVREGVLRLSDDWLAHLSLPQRLKLVAEGLVFAGFGRARVWHARGFEYVELMATASCEEDHGGPAVPPDLQGRRLPYKDDPNVARAVERGTALAVREWKPGRESPYQHLLGLHPPYVIVPVMGEQEQLEALLCLDFVPLEEHVRERRFNLLADDEQLKTLQVTYGGEVLNALRMQPDSGHAWNRLVEQAQLQYATAASVTEAARALTSAFRQLLPEAAVVVDLKPRDRPDLLRREPRLSCGPIPEGLPRTIPVDDPGSLAALAARTRKTYWLNDWPTERQRLLAANEESSLAGFRSAAAMPLRFELSIHGVLTLYTTKEVSWEDSGYQMPLRSLSRFVGLVSEDSLVEQALVRATLDREALAAQARAASEDSVWRHWASGKLFQSSLVLARAERQWNLDPTAPQVLQELRKAKQLLDTVAREEHPEAKDESCDLAGLFVELRKQYPSGTRPSIHLPDGRGLPRIQAPRYFAKHTLSVLIDNAIEAMQQSGCGTAVTVSVESKGPSSVCLLVRDDGPGIPEPIAEHLFEAPVSSEKPGGQGMGLFLARGTVLQYGGDLQLRPSELGTEFLLTYPRAR